MELNELDVYAVIKRYIKLITLENMSNKIIFANTKKKHKAYIIYDNISRDKKPELIFTAPLNTLIHKKYYLDRLTNEYKIDISLSIKEILVSRIGDEYKLSWYYCSNIKHFIVKISWGNETKCGCLS